GGARGKKRMFDSTETADACYGTKVRGHAAADSRASRRTQLERLLMIFKTEEKRKNMLMLEVAFSEVASKLHRISILSMATSTRSTKVHEHFLFSLHRNNFIEVEGQLEGQGSHVDVNFFSPVQEEGMLAGDAIQVAREVHHGHRTLDLNFVAPIQEARLLEDDDPREQENPTVHAVDENYDMDQIEYDWHEYGVYTNYVDIVYEDDDELNSNQKDANECSRHKDFTHRERQDVYEELLQRYHKGVLKKGSTNAVADKFNIHPRTVQRVWERAKKCIKDGVPVVNSGRKKVVVDLSMVASVSLLQRSTIRSLADAIGMSKSSVHRCYKERHIRRHSNTLKSYLKEANKLERLQWCISMLDPLSLPNNPKFIEMKYIIHIDEKWFNATKKDRNFYLLPDEEDPYRTVQNKNAMEKCMLLCGVRLPWFDDEGNCIFDGKIGIWPFVRKEPAQRSSQNRPRGTLITKTMKVDRDTSRSFLISKVLPAIQAKWPQQGRHETIWIQQDNAPSHVRSDDEQFNIAVQQTGLDIRLINQPPNSPNMNCVDLGFFASLRSLAFRRVSRNLDELIENVEKEFSEYNPCTLRRVFLTLQGCMLQ
ncbi:LOW QUALITY PROTEIN: hypothetical protein U9M48_036501, partial [Paspalum notatum var. saurae]